MAFVFTTFTGAYALKYERAYALKYERAYALKYERVKAKEVKIPFPTVRLDLPSSFHFLTLFYG
jgi:hypothetical protein